MYNLLQSRHSYVAANPVRAFQVFVARRECATDFFTPGLNMNAKNPVSALRMETGSCHTTEVPPIENVSAKCFPWNTIKNIITHTRHLLSLYLNITSPYPIVRATFPQTNWRNNHIFYTISKLSCDKDHMCWPFMGSSLQNSRGFKTAQYDMVQWPGKAKPTTVAKLSSWRGFVVCVA